MALARPLALAVLLALCGSATWACSSGSTELKRVRTPREGVPIEYRLEVGQGFEGQLRVGNTLAIDGLTAPLSQTATCDVNMAVLGTTPAGTEIRATFTSVELVWDLPPSATYSTDELLDLASKRLRGMQVTFVVRPDGRVEALPRPPADAPPELREVIETLLLGLEAFFVPTPPEPLRRGDEWSATLSHDTADGLRRELDQTLRLDGSYEHRSEDLKLRRVEVEQKRREQRPGESGPRTVERNGRAVMMFSTDGYPLELDREVREFDPVHGMVFRKVRARWSRSRGLVPELLEPPETGDVQVISDPCNADYVGPLDCKESPMPTSEEADDAEETADATDDAEAAEDAEETDAADDEATDDAEKAADAGGDAD